VAAPAVAADLPLKAPPPPVPVWNWSGFYTGGNVGYLVEHETGTSTFTQPGPRDPVTAMPNAVASTSWVGGGQVGFNWQVAPMWVVGVEADWDWTNPSYNFCSVTDSGNCVDAGNNNRGAIFINGKTEWLATVRARIGWTWDRFFFYATGGGAWGKVDSTLATSCQVGGCGNDPTSNSLSASFISTRSGWVAGLGTEFLLTNNWTTRLEWLHYDLGTQTDTLLAPPAFGSYAVIWSRPLRFDTVRVALNYKFGWFEPVVAKY
jgi:outer membrane immunogenic protein